MVFVNRMSNICYKCKYSYSFKPYLICEKQRKYVECFDCCHLFEKDERLIYDKKRIVK